jgi:hypothetical protein
MFAQAAVPFIDAVTEACVSAVCPLKIGDFGFVYTKKSIMVGQDINISCCEPCCHSNIYPVVSLCSKTGGKNSMHAAITDSSHIGGVSNISVQLFEYMYGWRFQVIPEATATFLTKQFGLITQMAFLSVLLSSPDV